MFWKIMLPILCGFLITSCQTDNCNCQLDNEIQRQSNTLLDSIKKNSKAVSFWEHYKEPYLFDLDHNSYRFFEEHWMKDIKRIYRVSKEESTYYLFYKNFKDGIIDNELGLTDSLTIYYKIPLQDSIVLKLEKLLEQNCFWTFPLKQQEEKIYSHPRRKLFEANEQDGNPCINKKYHFVDILSNKRFEAIVKEFVKIVEDYKRD